MTVAEIDLKIHPWQGNLQWKANTHPHTHTLLLPLQADDVTGYDGYKSVCVLVCIGAVFLCGVFVNQALLNLKIITFMTNQHHRRRSASCAKRKYTKPARKRERERE